MLSEQKVKEIANQVRASFPRAWGNCHREGSPETDDYIILVCKELVKLDSTVGCNGKRATNELSHDAIWNDGRIIDIVARAGGDNPDVTYNDVTSDSTVGGVVMGKFIDPRPLRTHFDYSSSETKLGISFFGALGLFLHDKSRYNEFLDFYKKHPQIKYARVFWYLAGEPWSILGTGHRSDGERRSAFTTVVNDLKNLEMQTQVCVFGVWVEDNARRLDLANQCKSAIKSLPRETFFAIDCFNEPGAIGVPEYGFVREIGRLFADIGIPLSLASPNSLHIGVDGRRATDAEVIADSRKLYGDMPVGINVVTPHWGRAPWEPHRNLGIPQKQINDEPRGIESSVTAISNPADFAADFQDSKTHGDLGYTLHGEPGWAHGYIDTTGHPEWEHNNSLPTWQKVPNIEQIMAALGGAVIPPVEKEMNLYPDENTYWKDFEEKVSKLYKDHNKNVSPEALQVGRHFARTAYDLAVKLSPEESAKKHLKEVEDLLNQQS